MHGKHQLKTPRKKKNNSIDYSKEKLPNVIFNGPVYFQDLSFFKKSTTLASPLIKSHMHNPTASPLKKSMGDVIKFIIGILQMVIAGLIVDFISKL